MRKPSMVAAGLALLAPLGAGCINLDKGFSPKRSFVLEAERKGDRLPAAPGALLPVLGVLTGLGGLTVAQRGWSAWRRLSRPAEPEPAGPQPGGDGWQEGQK